MVTTPSGHLRSPELEVAVPPAPVSRPGPEGSAVRSEHPSLPSGCILPHLGTGNVLHFFWH